MLFPWILTVHLALFLACVGYAAALQRVYRWYHPDRTWITVVIGETLVGLALGALCAAGVLPWSAAAYFITLQGAAGLPIIFWQLAEAQARRARRDALKAEEREHATQARRS